MGRLHNRNTRLLNYIYIICLFIFVQSAIGNQQVETMTAVKNELEEYNLGSEVLNSWSGDPCVPAPWQGLFCHSANGTWAITRIDLSLYKLRGPLPPSITELMYLKKLNLSNNHFIGTIPAFPASSSLTSIDISHNNLNGDIAELLISLPNLTTIYFGCNPLLSNGLEDSINRSNMMSTDTGICTGQNSKRRIVTGAVTAVFLLVTLAVCISLICNCPRISRSGKNLEGKEFTITKSAIYSTPTEIMPKTKPIETYTLQLIEVATQKYKRLIGEGGFGPVYRGTLPDGQEIAVKIRSSTSTQGTREFDNEVNLLSDIHHKNLVPLLGYCLENYQRVLVYPFMSNGSLQDKLYGAAAKRKTLEWPTRLSIALGAAEGLTYLHTFPGRSIIHRDVKSSNILLDQSMCAKVADFGFSKYAPEEGDSGNSLEVRGTAGYLDPEYYSTQQLSEKSDVFSFGIVLLEIVTGREPLNTKKPCLGWSLVEWAKPLIRNSRIDEVVDPSIKGGYHTEAMWRVIEVALACTESYSAYRPCMADIVRELEDALIIENNASEYMKSIESLGGSSSYSAERPIIIIPTPTQTEPSPTLSEASPPQPR